MNIFKTIAVALSMFSAVPVPSFRWDEKNMRYVLCAFPIVGLISGLCWAAVSLIHIPDILRGALFCIIPVIITGGIHLDGYADTWDALASWGNAEKKQEILHDPHTGALAVIRLCCYFAAYFALCAVLVPNLRAVICAGLGFMLSRTLSGWSLVSLPIAKGTGLAYTFASSADKKRVRRILVCLAAVIAVTIIVIGRLSGIAVILASVAVMLRYADVAEKQFGGISGDLAGWVLQ